MNEQFSSLIRRAAVHVELDIAIIRDRIRYTRFDTLQTLQTLHPACSFLEFQLAITRYKNVLFASYAVEPRFRLLLIRCALLDVGRIVPSIDETSRGAGGTIDPDAFPRFDQTPTRVRALCHFMRIPSRLLAPRGNPFPALPFSPYLQCFPTLSRLFQTMFPSEATDTQKAATSVYLY